MLTKLKQFDDHRKVVAVLLVILLAVGVAMLPLRTPGADESLENKTLTVNMKAYVDLLLPESAPLRQELADYEDITEFIERDHGHARSYWIWPLMQLTDSLEAAGWLYALHIYLTFLLGLYALYRIVWRLTGSWRWGLVGAGMLCLNPRMFAEAFFNNKDLMLLSVCLVVFWLGLDFIEKTNWASCVWFGLASAVVINTRVIGLGAFGIVGLCYLAWLTLNRKWTKRAFLRGVLAVAVCLAAFYLLTPACWGGHFWEFWQFYLGASGNFSTERWNGWVLYRGAVYNAAENPVPWHYIPWFMAITTPLLVLALAALWPVLAAVKNGREARCWASLESLFGWSMCLFAGLPLLYAMVVRPNIYNGWRHFYFIYAAVVILAPVSARWLAQSRKAWAAPAVTAALALNFIYYAGYIGVQYPNEYAYFNVLAGPHPEERYDADYWYIGLPGVIRDILEEDPNARVCDVGTRHLLKERWYALRDRHPELYGEKAEENVWERRWRCQYVLENTSYWKIEQLHNNWDEATRAEMQLWAEQLAEAPVLHEIKCGRTVLWRVYENPQYRE